MYSFKVPAIKLDKLQVVIYFILNKKLLIFEITVFN